MPRNSDANIASAVALARLLVQQRPTQATDSHLRELLGTLVWKVTEAAGKKRVRYQSEQFYLRRDAKDWQHEHVYERAKIITKLLDEPEQIEKTLRGCIACIVLKEEHDLLTKVSKESPELDGWDRYKRAGIRVFDTEEEVFLW